jgi:dATP pyrophosphohydrolase
LAESYLGATWQLISGELEPGETAWEGALREMEEETGLTARAFYRLSTLTSFYRSDDDSLNVAPMFCAIVDEGAVPTISSEHDGFEWVDVDTSRSRLMWPDDREALDEVRSVILGDGPAKPYMRIR